MNLERRDSSPDRPERSPAETLYLAEAIAARNRREAALNIGEAPTDFASLLDQAVATGRSMIVLRNVEKPHDPIEVAKIVTMLPLGELAQQQAEQQIAFTKKTDPTIGRLLENQPASLYQQNLEKVTAMLSGFFSPMAKSDRLREEVTAYQLLLPASQEVATSHGVTLPDVFTRDDLYEETVRVAYTPETFLQQEVDQFAADSTAFQEALVEDLTASLRGIRRGQRRQRAFEKLQVARQVSQYNMSLKQTIQSRLARFWSEEVIASLPPDMQEWLHS